MKKGVNLHTLTALLLFLSEKIAEDYPSADADSAWPTTSDVTSAIQQNPRYFPTGYTALTSYRKLLVSKGWLEIGPCAAVAEAMKGKPWHHPTCEHWRLTVAGLAGLARMNREGCTGGCKHRKVASFKLAA
jgi:hypothetical protein